MLKPTCHLNGTSPAELRAQYVDAYHAVEAAIEAVRKTCPDGRDYYPQGPGMIVDARKEHEARIFGLRALSDQMMELAQHVDGFCKD